MSTNIKTWRERLDGDGCFVSGSDGDTVRAGYMGTSAAIAARDAEIADLRAALAAKTEAPSTLAQQVAQAKAEFDSWSPELRASVRLHGGDNSTSDAQDREYTAIRLRAVCNMLGLAKAVPEKDDELMGCMFSVLGMVRRKIKELQAVPAVQQGGEAAEKVKCQHIDTAPRWDHIQCTSCGAVRTSGSEWGIANNTWFDSIALAKFYMKNGRLPDAPAAPHPVMDDKSAAQDIGCEPPAPPCIYCGSTSECDQTIAHPAKHGKGAA